MPTPSSDQPPDPSSPPPFTFSTCPDDVQYPPRSPHQATATSQQPDSIEVRPDSSLDGPSPPAFESHADRGEHVASHEARVLGYQPSSPEPSSRATTVSPGPQSTATEITSPVPSGPDNDIAKACESGPDGPVSQTMSTASRRSPGGTSTSSLARDMDPQDLLMYDDGDDLFSSTSMGMDFSSMRTIPISPSSYLRPGSRFHGTQQSERQVYDVQVEIKHVDMRESFLCGYLRIQGLTEDHPTLTTYFEGEIIGSKYGFVTQHEDWGASLKTDMNHWSKFGAFRPFQKHVRKGPVVIQDVAQKENIFMRWKEHFLMKGEVNGIYFHSKSEKFQQLELKHVPDRGCFSATEFR
ncbi:vacuolar import and degradation protein [Hirsutella rhossiliensis]|uniref:Vacuolar import and degradation protein n=1 Tax=Hirsutella rhossiliensis TaxID=111463 RepID=A0A9P8SMT8_9HYPO|nr:vacuolar import and degradation protein [Hirsutella rhossiliensis]KAH0968356.1 vacuolar import and degradation protein [Hirsutella rhossiliensis]